MCYSYLRICKCNHHHHQCKSQPDRSASLKCISSAGWKLRLQLSSYSYWYSPCPEADRWCTHSLKPVQPVCWIHRITQNLLVCYTCLCIRGTMILPCRFTCSVVMNSLYCTVYVTSGLLWFSQSLQILKTNSTF